MEIKCRNDKFKINNQHIDYTVIDFKGDMIAAFIPAMKEQLNSIINENNKRIILNLTNIELIDSSGLGGLLSVLRNIRNLGGTLKLYGLNQQLKQTFNLTKLDRVFEIYEDEYNAVNSLIEEYEKYYKE